MIGDILKSIFGDKNAKDKKLYWPYVELANAAHEHIKTLSDEQLRQKSKKNALNINWQICAPKQKA
ncbi:MAG: hypothetical protein RLZZ585_204 [Bacteroidota bacterium]